MSQFLYFHAYWQVQYDVEHVMNGCTKAPNSRFTIKAFIAVCSPKSFQNVQGGCWIDSVRFVHSCFFSWSSSRRNCTCWFKVCNFSVKIVSNHCFCNFWSISKWPPKELVEWFRPASMECRKLIGVSEGSNISIKIIFVNFYIYSIFMYSWKFRGYQRIWPWRSDRRCNS